MRWPIHALLALFLLLRATWPTAAFAASPPLDLKDGDRVVFVGDAFTERQQAGNYLETLLTAQLAGKNVVFRNLGWSGDTVFGEARAVFGKASDGFFRLIKDVRDCQPTVIVVCYGANEANQGEAGLPTFAAGLEKLLAELEKNNARVVLLSPLERERLAPPLPDPAAYNRVLTAYAAAIQEAAAQHKLAYVNLLGLVPRNAAPLSSLDQMTDNGLHLSPYGYWRTAPLIAARLGIPPAEWKVEIDAAGNNQLAVGTSVNLLKARGDGVLCSFTCDDRALPVVPVPAHAPAGAQELAPIRTLKLAGLAPGKYNLTIDDQLVATATHDQWAAGVRITAGPEFTQAEALRQAIGEKNQLYFHRYRPENETYLFLFRKHEQGNNAVEIPQFDPLVAEKEKQIATLKEPRPHTYQLIKQP